MYQRLVIPLDGSEIAERALIEATELASLAHTPMHLVRVIDSASSDITVVYGKLTDSDDTAVLLADDVNDACQYLDDVARRLGDGGQRITHEVRCGPAAGQLVDAAQSGDLYVMASHGRTGMSRCFMGSVAEEVVRRIPVPVLLVRAGVPVNPSETHRSLAWS